jgi:hypothetical protein
MQYNIACHDISGMNVHVHVHVQDCNITHNYVTSVDCTISLPETLLKILRSA